MNWHHDPRKILLTGKSGSGKSTLSLALLRDFRGQVFVFDHKPEIIPKLSWPAARNLAELNGAAAEGRPVVFFPSYMFPGDRPGAFAFFARWCFNVAGAVPGKKLFYCDEIQKFTRLGQGGVPGAFQEILDDGRLRCLDVLLIASKPQLVNADIRGQLTELYTFQHTDRLPLRWLEEDGFDPGAVSKLKNPGGWLWRNLDTGAEKRSEIDPKRKTDRRAGREG